MMKTASRMVVLCHSALGNSVFGQFKNKWIKIKFSSYLPVIYLFQTKCETKKKAEWGILCCYCWFLQLSVPSPCLCLLLTARGSRHCVGACPALPASRGKHRGVPSLSSFVHWTTELELGQQGQLLVSCAGAGAVFLGFLTWSSTSAALIRRLGGRTRRCSPGRWSPVHTCILNSEVKGEQPVKQSTVPPGITAHEEAASGPGLLPQSCEGSAWPPCHGHRAAGVLCWVVWSQGHCQSARPGLQCNPWQNFWLHQGELWEAQNDCCIQWFISVLLSVGWEVLTPIKMSDNYTKSPNLE